MAQYTYTGYDASAHVAEETHDAARSAPRGIVLSVVVSVVAGFLLLFAITWAIQNYDGRARPATGFPPAQIFIDAAGRHMGEFLLFICVIAQFFCGMASVTANSRMASRSAGTARCRVRGSGGRSTRAPVRRPTRSGCAWSARRSWCCRRCGTSRPTGAPPRSRSSGSTSPTWHRSSSGCATPTSRSGPWHLGRWSEPIGWTAIVWVIIICVHVRAADRSYPIAALNFNYTIVAVVVVSARRGCGGCCRPRTGSPAPANIDDESVRGHRRRHRRPTYPASGAIDEAATPTGRIGRPWCGRSGALLRSLRTPSARTSDHGEDGRRGPVGRCAGVAAGTRRQRLRDHRRPAGSGDPAGHGRGSATGCRPSANSRSGSRSAG